MDKKIKQQIMMVSDEKYHLQEICEICGIQTEFIIEMVEYHVLEPQGEKPEEWRFDSISLKRGRTASSFYHDLEVNMAGIALALDLLEQIDDLRKQISLYHRK